jgi:hypothetical protein
MLDFKNQCQLKSDKTTAIFFNLNLVEAVKIKITLWLLYLNWLYIHIPDDALLNHGYLLLFSNMS